MIYLLDTDIFIFLLRGKAIVTPKNERERERQRLARRIVAWCREAEESNDIVGLSAITIAELEFGARHSGDYESNSEALRDTLSPFASFDFDADECAICYGEVRQALESVGTPIGGNDLLIASHAKALGAILVTNNTGEFSRVAGLKCENWSK